LYGNRSGSLKNKIIITLCFLLLVFISQYGLAGSTEDINTGERDLNQSIIDFVTKIYQSYSEEDFKFVYEKLHPDLKDIISEEEYIKFQEENFRKYKLEIGKIKVMAEVSETVLPDKFTGLLKTDEEVYTIKVSYEMKFETAGIEKKHENEKEILIARKDEKLYLLWDPSIVDD
jgi:hypothetical protein